ncbi:unannotated protein [freshwater metagenome]|uniref:Unannotated protein n=1 Tax=freshwater metagenome TaxID=449393 RepID=A0A6J7D013_9ZZZZ|nr:hypothetical protein [Actinomycetota bacterium]
MNDGALSYYRVLDLLHQSLNPRTYVEIGVREGDSACLALDVTTVIAVDPCARILRPLAAGAIVERCTSDDFFASGRISQHLSGRPIDLAFIDGMHLWEFALRDFLNIERSAHPGTVVLLHDCLPPGAVEAQRQRSTNVWTGDVWKLLYYLREERPDLEVTVLDARPTGLGVIRNLDPSRALPDLEEAWRKYGSLSFDTFETDLLPTLRVVKGDWSAMRDVFPVDPWQNRGSVAELRAQRDRRHTPPAMRLRQAKRRLGKSALGPVLKKVRRTLVGSAKTNQP